jgi:hypothetical protein
MATKSPPPLSAKQNRPPDEKFWVKYSPHHEMTISGMASLAWHTLAIVLMVVVAWVVASGNRDAMPLEAVEFDGGIAGSGSGGNGGTGTDRANGNASPLVEAVAASRLPSDAKAPKEALHDIANIQITPDDLLKNLPEDKNAERELAKAIRNGSKALEQLANLDRQMRDALIGGVGNGSPGKNGGSGDGTQGGNGTSPGTGNERIRRQARWTITFNTQSGGDYLRQVQALGAILAFNTPAGDLVCVKDLARKPVQTEKVDKDELKKLNRLFWIDDRRDSVEQLARAMGLDFTPDKVYALFSHEVEKELLRKELAFQNKKEHEIYETRFQFLMRGSGYEIVVIDQRLEVGR